MTTALEEYLSDVLDGKVTACGKIVKLAERLTADIEAADAGGSKWAYDRRRAERAVEFIERFCKMPSGKLGSPFVMEPYERAIVQALFGFVDADGLRRFQEAFIVLARKNGKTTLAAAIELYMLVADGEGSPQIYNLATSGDQADLCYRACVKMVRQSGAISKHVKKRADDLYCAMNMGFIRPMNANPGTLDGLDVHAAVLDELAAMKTRDLYDLVRQGMAARSQPLMLEITTNGFIRNSIYDSQYEYAAKWLDGEVDDDRFVAFVYELDDRDEWDDPDMWVKANPGLGTVKKEEFLRSNVERAKNDPSYLPTVLVKDFNVPQTSASAWLTYEEAVNRETVDMASLGLRYGVCGFDAADTIDLTAAQMLMMRPGDDHIYMRSMYWIPEDAVEEHAARGRDRDNAPYRQWIARGLLRTVPGNKVDKAVLLDWLTELRDEEGIYCYALGYDPWHMDDSTVRSLEGFVGKSRCRRVRQGAITLSQPMKQLRADYRAGRIVDNDHPINQWCRMNVTVKADANGNIQPYKKENDPRNRIDGFAAELDAYVVLCDLMADYQAMIGL